MKLHFYTNSVTYDSKVSICTLDLSKHPKSYIKILLRKFQSHYITL